jgi:hypothetical protein
MCQAFVIHVTGKDLNSAAAFHQFGYGFIYPGLDFIISHSVFLS